MIKKYKLVDAVIENSSVILYLGKESQDNFFYGDDWDDPYYQHNADLVYDRFVERKIMAVVDFKKYFILEYGNAIQDSAASKEEFKFKFPYFSVVEFEPEDSNDIWALSNREVFFSGKNKFFHLGDIIEIDDSATIVLYDPDKDTFTKLY